MDHQRHYFFVCCCFCLTLKAIQRQASIAEKSVNAQIDAEVAWIGVIVERTPGFSRTVGTSESRGVHNTQFTIRVRCENHGKTPAWITQKRAAFTIVREGEIFPPSPNLNATELFNDEPQPMPAGFSSPNKDVTLTAEGTEGIGDLGVIWGVVKFRDIYIRERQTTFGFKITLDDRLEHLPGFPEYNRNS